MKIDFSPDKNFFELPVVRLCASIFGGLALLSALLIAYNLRELPFDLSGDGFNKFAIYYKVPAAFAAIGFTIVGLCAANHRSGQSRAQMELTAKQNVFANHFKHVEEFEKYCKGRHENIHDAFETEVQKYKKHSLPEEIVALSGHVAPTHYRAVYKKIFPKSKEGNFDISDAYVESIDSFAVAMVEAFHNFTETGANWDCMIYDLDWLVMTYADTNHIELPAISRVAVNCSGKVRNVPQNVEVLFALAQDVIHVQLHALSFDTDYVESDTARKFLQFDCGNIPDIVVGEYAGLPLKAFPLPNFS